MKLLFAEDALSFLEEKISFSKEWLKRTGGASPEGLQSVIKNLSKYLLSFRLLSVSVEKAKLNNNYNDSLTIRDAELMIEELESRAYVNQMVGISLMDNVKSGVIEEVVQSALLKYHTDAQSTLDVIGNMKSKLCLAKLSADVDVEIDSSGFVVTT